jgi:3-oxoacyl-[acyl-carrier protein] reductase
VTKPADIIRLIEATVSTFGGIFALVNNSGGPPAGTFDQFDDTAWQSAFELNLLSYVRTIRAALPHLRKGGGGRIINFASTSVKSPIDNLILSNTFRTGVLGLTKTLASELGRDGILINVIGPGRIQTDRIEQLDANRATNAGISIEQVRTNTCNTIPLGRYGTPEEYAKFAVFLGSPANTYITGQTVLVDGGMVKGY